MTRYERKYRSVARSLSHLELMRSSLDDLGAPLSEVDLLDKDAGRRFMDFYGDEGIRLVLRKYGIEAALERRGYVAIDVDTEAGGDRHTLIVTGEAGGVRHRLVELVVRRDRLVPEAQPGMPELSSVYDVLTVDWLLLSNPLASFRPERMRLPGQTYPGLGIGERVLEILYRMVDRLRLDGLFTVADHFHNAVLYRRELPFWDPAADGQLRALQDLLLEKEKLSLAQASWAVEWGFVRCADDSPFTWHGEGQLRAMHEELRAWIVSPAYEERAERARKHARYTLARAWLDERWAAEKEALLEHGSP